MKLSLLATSTLLCLALSPAFATSYRDSGTASPAHLDVVEVHITNNTAADPDELCVEICVAANPTSHAGNFTVQIGGASVTLSSGGGAWSASYHPSGVPNGGGSLGSVTWASRTSTMKTSSTSTYGGTIWCAKVCVGIGSLGFPAGVTEPTWEATSTDDEDGEHTPKDRTDPTTHKLP